MINEQLYEKAKKIKLLILDVDGVLTDGRVWFTPTGEIIKSFHIHDGHGIKQLQTAGIVVAIISNRKDPAVVARLRELNIKHYYVGQNDKLTCYHNLMHDLKLNAEEIAYVGDDLPDLPVMQEVGLSIAVANAIAQIRQIAHWHTKKSGGEGAVREVCDLILSVR